MPDHFVPVSFDALGGNEESFRIQVKQNALEEFGNPEDLLRWRFHDPFLF
jgi:hypothetical protein